MDAQADAAKSQHGVCFVKTLYAFENVFLFFDLFQQRIDLFECSRVLQSNLMIRQITQQINMVGQKFMQRRIDQANDHRQSVHNPKKTGKVLPLKRQKRFEGFTPLTRQVGHNHFLYKREPFSFEKHVFGATQADAFGTVIPGHRQDNPRWSIHRACGSHPPMKEVSSARGP